MHWAASNSKKIMRTFAMDVFFFKRLMAFCHSFSIFIFLVTIYKFIHPSFISCVLGHLYIFTATGSVGGPSMGNGHAE